jgi:hypothetical protein
METKQKQRYKVKNWPEYNQAMVNPDSLMLWFEESQLERWHQPERTGYRGSLMSYSDWAIQCVLTIREIFQCPLRETESFLKSLVKILSLPLKVPNYRALSRRQQTIGAAWRKPLCFGLRHY